MPSVKHLTAVQNWQTVAPGQGGSESETIAVVIVDDEGNESLWVGDYSSAAESGLPETAGDDRPLFRWMSLPLPNLPGKPAQVFRLGPEPQRIAVPATAPAGRIEQ